MNELDKLKDFTKKLHKLMLNDYNKVNCEDWCSECPLKEVFNTEEYGNDILVCDVLRDLQAVLMNVDIEKL